MHRTMCESTLLSTIIYIIDSEDSLISTPTSFCTTPGAISTLLVYIFYTYLHLHDWRIIGLQRYYTIYLHQLSTIIFTLSEDSLIYTTHLFLITFTNQFINENPKPSFISYSIFPACVPWSFSQTLTWCERSSRFFVWCAPCFLATPTEAAKLLKEEVDYGVWYIYSVTQLSTY